MDCVDLIQILSTSQISWVLEAYCCLGNVWPGLEYLAPVCFTEKKLNVIAKQGKVLQSHLGVFDVTQLSVFAGIIWGLHVLIV